MATKKAVAKKSPGKNPAAAEVIHGPAKDEAQREAFDAVVAKQPPETRALAQKARALVLRAMPGVLETIWPKQGVTSYGTGPKKMSDHFTFFLFNKSHLSFGF